MYGRSISIAATAPLRRSEIEASKIKASKCKNKVPTKATRLSATPATKAAKRAANRASGFLFGFQGKPASQDEFAAALSAGNLFQGTETAPESFASRSWMNQPLPSLDDCARQLPTHVRDLVERVQYLEAEVRERDERNERADRKEVRLRESLKAAHRVKLEAEKRAVEKIGNDYTKLKAEKDDLEEKNHDLINLVHQNGHQWCYASKQRVLNRYKPLGTENAELRRKNLRLTAEKSESEWQNQELRAEMQAMNDQETELIATKEEVASLRELKKTAEKSFSLHHLSCYSEKQMYIAGMDEVREVKAENERLIDLINSTNKQLDGFKTQVESNKNAISEKDQVKAELQREQDKVANLTTINTQHLSTIESQQRRINVMSGTAVAARLAEKERVIDDMAEEYETRTRRTELQHITTIEAKDKQIDTLRSDNDKLQRRLDSAGGTQNSSPPSAPKASTGDNSPNRSLNDSGYGGSSTDSPDSSANDSGQSNCAVQ